MKHTAIALLAAALTLQANADVHLVPAGEFSGRDGRPLEVRTWKLSDAQGRALAARLTARHVKTKFQFDYEHQALQSEKNGQPAPAAAWAQRFEWRDGDGLYALDVQWTKRAREMLEADEYKYISPVLVYDKKTGEVLDVFNASLVGNPNLLELNPAASETVARLNAFFTQQESSDMNPILKALLTALGLTESATEAEATTALSALQIQASQVEGLQAEVATLKGKVTTAEAATAALSAQAGQPDPTKWVSIDRFNTLSTEVASLQASRLGDEVDQLIQGAEALGKCSGVVSDVWRDVGKKDIAQLRALIDKTPANPALAGRRQTDGRTEPADPTADESAVLAICSATGITVDEFKAAAPSQA
jgi:phage I-like protein